MSHTKMLSAAGSARLSGRRSHRLPFFSISPFPSLLDFFCPGVEGAIEDLIPDEVRRDVENPFGLAVA